MPNVHLCTVCGCRIDKELHAHRVKAFWPDDVRRALARRAVSELKMNSLVCCKHFETANHPVRFSAKHPPKLRRGLDGAHWQSQAARPAPKRKFGAISNSEESVEALRAENAELRQFKTEIKQHSLCINLLSDDNQAQWLGFSQTGPWVALRTALLAQLPKKWGNNDQWDPQTRLVIFMSMLKMGMAAKQLSLLVGRDDSTIRKMFDNTLGRLQNFANDHIKLLSKEELFRDNRKTRESTFEDCLLLCVDGTLIEIESPSDHELYRTCYSYKHQQTGWAVQVLVTPRGRICALSKLDGGAMHDSRQWRESGLVRRLQDEYRTAKVEVNNKEYQLALAGDKAYVHMEKPAGWRVIVTKSAESELAAEGRDAPPDVTLDPGIAIIRSVVERAIGYLKQFQMLRMPSLMRDYKRASHCVTLIAGMVNWLIEHNQIENL